MNVLIRGLDPGLLELIDSEVALAPKVVAGATRNAVLRTLISEAISARRRARGEDVFEPEPVGRVAEPEAAPPRPAPPKSPLAEALDAAGILPRAEIPPDAPTPRPEGAPRRIGVPERKP